MVDGAIGAISASGEKFAASFYSERLALPDLVVNPDFRRFPAQLIDIIDARFPMGTTSSLSERCLDTVLTVVCFSLGFDRFCASVPAASGRDPRFRSGQRMSECVLRRQ